MLDTDIVKYNVGGCTFDIPSRYSNLQLKGFGAYGIVCSLNDNLASETVAIKKIPGPFRTEESAKRTYREVKLLKHLEHDNVISLRDIFVSPRDDIYMVTDLMSTDLSHIITAKPIEDEFIKYIFYQIMRGLKYIHSAGVVHRDLKPSNVLVDENCDVKLCDFGLARTVDTTMTGYYTVQVDIWSAGCILAEMISGTPLFPGQSHADQFSVIVDLLGSVPEHVLATISSKNTSNYIQSLPVRTKQSLTGKIKNASPKAIDLLEKLLVWDPKERLGAGPALAHPYLEVYHDPTDEPEAKEKFDWSSVAVDHTVDTWKILTYSEIMNHHSDRVSNDLFDFDNFENMLHE